MASVSSIVKEMTKDFSDGVMNVGGVPLSPDRVPTGCFEYDLCTGGGFPKGRLSMPYGSEACVSGDTHIPYTVWRDGKRSNNKGGTIKALYNRFNKMYRGVGAYDRGGDCRYTVAAVDENDSIHHIPILKVVKTGIKKVYEVTVATGDTLTCTEDHRLYLGDGEYSELKDLNVGDSVMIHNKYGRGREKQTKYKTITVRSHPVRKPTQVYKGADGTTYEYYQLPVHKLVAEAALNNLSFDGYIAMLNAGTGSDLVVLREGEHVHHKDGDRFNNDLPNLEIVSNSEHGKKHIGEHRTKMAYVCRPQIITSIEYVGERETYDMECARPYNNYVAGKFVTHNSLKTTMALKAIATNQQMNPDESNVFVDAENALDLDRAEELGVDTKTDKFVHILPDYAEQVVDIIEGLLHASDIGVIVLDSVSALSGYNETISSADKAVVGGTGLVIGKLYRKSTLALNKARREGRFPTFIAINQIRHKIGVMFGDNETVSGGNAFKFASSLTIRTYGKEIIDPKIHKDIPCWNECSVIIKKKKVPVLTRTTSFKMAMIPVGDLGVGQTNAWNTVVSHLKTLGMLVKDNKAKRWVLFGEQYKTQAEIKTQYELDYAFKRSLEQSIFNCMMTGELPDD
jgi:recombination protein RecA